MTTATAQAPKADKKDDTFQTEMEYEYWDIGADGKPFLSYVVVKQRYTSGRKNFPQKRPNPDFNAKKPKSKDNPEWIWNLSGVKKILYRLPELRRALYSVPGRWVFVLEGEKDVDTAMDAGLCSTTQPGGAQKWTEQQYSDELKGQNVILVPDEDPVMENHNKPGTFMCPGIDHVREVAAKLLKEAKTIKLLRLPDVPPSGDFSDWRRASGVPNEELRDHMRPLIADAVTIRTQADIDAIRPRGESVWPIPAGQWPDSLPRPKPSADDAPGLFDGVEDPAAPKAPPIEQPNAVPPEAPKPVPVPPPVVNGPAPALSPGLAQVAGILADLRRAAPQAPRSTAEWAGEVWFAVAAFQQTLAALPGGAAGAGKMTREAALLLAAQLVRGAESVPDLR